MAADPVALARYQEALDRFNGTLDAAEIWYDSLSAGRTAPWRELRDKIAAKWDDFVAQDATASQGIVADLMASTALRARAALLDANGNAKTTAGDDARQLAGQAADKVQETIGDAANAVGQVTAEAKSFVLEVVVIVVLGVIALGYIARKVAP